MKLNVCTFVLGLIISINVLAVCPVAPSSQYECKGRVLITSLDDLRAYQKNFGFSEKKQSIRGAILFGDFSGSNLNVISPCPIKIKSGTSLDFSGDICLSSGSKVVGNDNITVNAANVTMTAPGRVVLRNNLNATISNDLSLQYYGVTGSYST